MTYLRRIHHQQGSHTFHDHQAVYMDEISRNTTLTLTRNHHLDIILQTNIQQIPSKMAPYKTEEESIRPFSETKSDFVEKYVLRPVGKPLTKEYRVYFNLNDKLLSPWHDLALYPGSNREPVVHMVVEVPRWWSAKMEVSPLCVLIDTQ